MKGFITTSEHTLPEHDSQLCYCAVCDNLEPSAGMKNGKRVCHGCLHPMLARNFAGKPEPKKRRKVKA